MGEAEVGPLAERDLNGRDRLAAPGPVR